MSRRLDVNVIGALALTMLLWGAAPPESPVADAAMAGDVERVRELLQQGADVNAAQGDGMTALHWAAEIQDAELVRMLVSAGANVGSLTRLGDYTPLHIASRVGSADVVDALLSAGADPQSFTSTGGVAPLHFAAAAGSAETVRVLLEHGADVDVREHTWQQTPLMFASASGRTGVVNALLDHGADPAASARVLDLTEREREDRVDRQRETQIQEQIRAAAEGRFQATRGGRDGAGAGRPTPPDPPIVSREQIELAQRDRLPTGRLSHAELVGGYGGLTALLLAAREGHGATAMTLIDRGADIDQVSGGDHTTPLLMATINGHFDLALTLLERGADPNVASQAGATPLYTTLNTQWIPKSRHPQPADYMQQQVGYLDLMRAFLDNGADVNVRLRAQLWYTTFGDDYLRTDRTGATPFWRAAYALDLDAMNLLLEYGADPSIPTLKTPGRSRGASVDLSGLPPIPDGGPGAYPIHAASGIGYGEGFAANIHRTVPNGWLPAVRFLVEELGADVNARDQNGYNAVHHAAARGDDELIRYLVEQGADVTAVSRRGQTTVDMANGPVQRITPFPSTIALLESLGAINNHNCVAC